MCTLCAGGEHIHQHPHFDTLVCLQHRRWVGLDTPPAEQHQISDGHLEAALTFRKLRRKHLLDVRLFTALMTAVRLDTDKDTQDSRPSASFPLAVETARIITSEQFGHKFYNPATTMKDAYRFLNETVHSTLGYPGPATTRTIWLCAHPTVYAIRRHLTTGSPFTLSWPHDLPVHPGVVNSFTMPDAGLEPLGNYLDLSRDTPLTVAAFASRIGHRVPLKSSSNFNRDKALEICSKGHQFPSVPANRLQAREGRKCPMCRGKLVERGVNDLATTHPELAREYADDHNDGRTSHDVSANSKTPYIWRCAAKGHLFKASPSNRAFTKSGCSVCLNRVVVEGINDLTTTHPALIAELDPSIVGTTIPTTHTATSEKAVTWVCTTCQHQYRMSIFDRTHDHGCPNCTRAKNQEAAAGLSATHPEIAAQWHPKFNGDRHPDQFTHGSREDAYWTCEFGHNYKMRIERRTAGRGCKVCSRRELVPNVNDLATQDPLLATEWHSYLNREDPRKVFPGTKRYWWRCLAHRHPEQQSVPDRRLSRGCTSCLPEERILNRTNAA